MLLGEDGGRRRAPQQQSAPRGRETTTGCASRALPDNRMRNACLRNDQPPVRQRFFFTFEHWAPLPSDHPGVKGWASAGRCARGTGGGGPRSKGRAGLHGLGPALGHITLRGGGGSDQGDGGGGGYGRPVDRGVWTAKTVKRPRQQPAHPQYANSWAPLTCKRRILPHSAQPQHTNYWAPRTRKQHQQEHRPQRPTERSERRTGDCPGPRKGATTRRNVTQGGIPPWNL